MAAVDVNFRLDENVKESMEKACRDMGLTMNDAFTIFAKTAAREHRIPSAAAADLFYADSSLDFIRRGVAALDAGKGSEHELIED